MPTALEVRPDCHLISPRHPGSLLHCNTFVRTFPGGSRWLVDPGSRIDQPIIAQNLLELGADDGRTDIISVNHQDPDVVGNLPWALRQSPRSVTLATGDTWRLLRHLAPRPPRLTFPESLPHGWLRIEGGKRVLAVPTPFCHFRGAIAFYDPELRILFSGDLFAGITRSGRSGLFAEEEDWPGIEQFHRLYMPSQAALRFALRRIEDLDPPVEIIAPQHGMLITGEMLPLFVERLFDLRVGAELLEADDPHLGLESYEHLAQELVDRAVAACGEARVLDCLQNPAYRDGLDLLTTIDHLRIAVTANGRTAIGLLLQRFVDLGERQFHVACCSFALDYCTKYELPLPDCLGYGVESSGDLGTLPI